MWWREFKNNKKFFFKYILLPQLKRIFIALSILLNVILWGYANQTFSARNYDLKKRGKINIVFLIDTLYWFDEDHCLHSWINWVIIKKRMDRKKMFYIYGNNNCTWCVKAKELAEAQGVKYQFKNINASHNMDLLRELYPKVKTIPQIWKDNTHIGGYEEFETFLKKGNKFNVWRRV